MEQTAVDWLHQISKQREPDKFDWEQAKAIEKEQIQKAFSFGREIPLNHPTLPHYSSEEYYNETYYK